MKIRPCIECPERALKIHELLFRERVKYILFNNEMKDIFSLLSILFLPILSLKESKPKLCVNCKHFITDNDSGKFGRCSLFPKEEENIYTLVNGISEDKMIEYYLCVSARSRENMCGEKGKKYKENSLKPRAINK